MSRIDSLVPRFVELMPAQLEDGVLYISLPYDTAVHRCCCGCGSKVVTPLGPTEWQLTRQGNSVSLRPSVGNWSFPCQSHYWVRGNRIEWAGHMGSEEIESGRRADRLLKERYYGSGSQPTGMPAPPTPTPVGVTWWQRFLAWLIS